MSKSSDFQIGMPHGSGLSHAVAAEAHDHAARAHRLAAEQFACGNHHAALELARQAATQAHSADVLSRNAQVRTGEPSAADKLTVEGLSGG